MILSLCGFVVFYYGAFRDASCLAFCSRVFSTVFNIVVISLGEKRAVLLVHLFVYFARVSV